MQMYVVLIDVFLKYAMRMRYSCREVQRTPEPALQIPRWPLDQSEYSVQSFALLNKRPQRERGGHCGNEVGTLRRDRNIAR